MYKEEIVIKFLGRSALVCSEVDQKTLREILEEVLNDYEVQPACTALAVQTDIQEKIALYLATKTIDGLSSETIYNYKLHLIRFSNYVRKNVSDITAIDVRVYLAGIAKQQNLQSTSVATEMSYLRSFFRWLEDEDYILKSPFRKIKQTKVPKMLRKSLTLEELEKLRDCCKTIRQRALLEFFFATGCRLSEIVELNLDDINWNSYSIKVFGKGSKERVVYFSPKVKLYLEKYINSRKDNCPAIFVTEKRPHHRLGKRAIQREIKKIAANAGFEKSIYPHLIRHTFATLGLRAGASLTTIQKLMGHTDPATTEVYAELNDEAIQEEYKKHFIQ